MSPPLLSSRSVVALVVAALSSSLLPQLSLLAVGVAGGGIANVAESSSAGGGGVQVLGRRSQDQQQARQQPQQRPESSHYDRQLMDRNDLNFAFVPKFEYIVFEQAFSGANAAYDELGNPGILEYVPPPLSASDSGAVQIDIIQRATQTGFNSIMLSNNAEDTILGSCKAAQEEGIDIITWDSPIPNAGVEGGEDLFVAQVDFDETGQVMADMTLDILGEEGGQFAILSASENAANQNAWNAAMEKVMKGDPEKYGHIEWLPIAFGTDDGDIAYEEALKLIDQYPDMRLIMSPTTIGIVSAAKAVQDRGLCDKVKVSGLGLPSDMLEYTLNGCAPLFALWSFVDLGYLTYYTAYNLAMGNFKVEPGATYTAGRLGVQTVEKDPTRPGDAHRVIMGGFTLYNKENIENAVFFEAVQGDGGQQSFEERYIEKYKKRAIAIIPKVTGMISFLFSGYIIWHVLRKPTRRRLTKNRLLVGISVHDMIASFFGFFLSTWPIPADTWLVYGAVGNQQTCTMQGFFFQGGISAGPLYSAALTTFYLLNVVFGWTSETIVRKAEIYLHAIPITFAWITAIVGLPLHLYNAADRVGFMCWIAEYPAYCSLRDTCERGKNADAYRWAFLYSWVFFVFLYMAFCMSWIYVKVLFAEKATDRWRRASGQCRRRRLSRKVASQGFQYVVAFIFPWIFGITVSIMMNVAYGSISTSASFDNAMTALEIVNVCIWPLKGFFTFVVYMRPRWRKDKDSSTGRRTTSSGKQSGNSNSIEGTESLPDGGTPTQVRASLFSFKSFLTRSFQNTSSFQSPSVKRGDYDGSAFQNDSTIMVVREPRSDEFKGSLGYKGSGLASIPEAAMSTELSRFDQADNMLSGELSKQPKMPFSASNGLSPLYGLSDLNDSPPASENSDEDGKVADQDQDQDVVCCLPSGRTAFEEQIMKAMMEQDERDHYLVDADSAAKRTSNFFEIPILNYFSEYDVFVVNEGSETYIHC